MEGKSEQVEVGRRLRSARETLGLTQGDVAAALEIQRTSVIGIEAGTRNITALELRQMARLYRRDVAWILGEGAETIEEDSTENQALFRATSQLSEEDKEQVLRFAQFLAAGEAPAGRGRSKPQMRRAAAARRRSGSSSEPQADPKSGPGSGGPSGSET